MNDKPTSDTTATTGPHLVSVETNVAHPADRVARSRILSRLGSELLALQERMSEP